MPSTGFLYNILQMEHEHEPPMQVVAPSKARGDDESALGRRQRCGCLRTSEKLRQLLCTFPAPPPPTPSTDLKNGIESMWAQCMNREGSAECVSADCKVPYHPVPVYAMAVQEIKEVPTVQANAKDKMEHEHEPPMQVVAPSKARGDDESALGRRQRCGCLRTSEKLRQLLCTFPAPPPPTPSTDLKNGIESMWAQCMNREGSAECVSADCKVPYHPVPVYAMAVQEIKEVPTVQANAKDKEGKHKVYQMVTELVQLVQLAVTATALAIYYLIYCYMQLVYYTLRSALYFHQADGAMKITIGIVGVTSFILAFNIIMRMDKIVGMFRIL